MTAEERIILINKLGNKIVELRPETANEMEVVEAVLVAVQIVTGTHIVAQAVDQFAPKSIR